MPPSAGGGPAPAALRLGLRDGVAAGRTADEGLVLDGAGVRFSFGRPGAGLRAALHRLTTTGEEEGRLADLVGGADGPAGLARLYYLLRRLEQRGLLTWTAVGGGGPLATLVPTSSAFAYAGRRPNADRSYLLSRFAYTRRRGGELVLESPLAHGRVVLHDGRVASLLHALATPGSVADVAARCPTLAVEEQAPLLILLLNGDLLVERSAGGASAADEEREDESPALRTWEFHDLLFHARSRNGRHDEPVGGTYRFLGRLPPPPALRPVSAERSVELYRPSLERLEREDAPYARVQEARASIRAYGDRPISDRQLGEFLYRVARVRQRGTVAAESPQGSAPSVPMELATRPYPGGGALHELELYAAVNACDGVPPGLYHYDPLGHRLSLRCGRTPDVEALLRYAGMSIGAPPERLQVLLVLAARVPRVAWKYASVAYALVLKDVGVVFQTMYLAATAMGLAPCALGGGDADLFAKAAGTDYYAESSVGEFLLGSRP